MTYTQSADWLKDHLPKLPEIAIVLGTGLNDMADQFTHLATLPYSEIPGFAQSTAPSHKGKLILTDISGKTVVFMQGRLHYYEGLDMQEITFPTRVLAALGVKTLIVTNAAGSLRKELVPGSIVQITDHINFMGSNPLIGPNDDQMGERFPSMNEAYDPAYRLACSEIAQKRGVTTHQGVYLAVTGPNLETKAECAAFAGMGADLVGMSTVPEVLVARHCGIRVLAYSIVTNYSNLFHSEAHSQEEIRRNAGKASEGLKLILTEFIAGLK